MPWSFIIGEFILRKKLELNVPFKVITGVSLVKRKVVFITRDAKDDKRGFLFEQLPGGVKDECLPTIGNVYTSVISDRGIAKGGHFHQKNSELMQITSGVAFLAFWNIETEEIFRIILGRRKYEGISSFDGTESFFLEDGDSVQVLVESGIYHVVVALTHTTDIFAFAIHPYDPSDYFTPNPPDDLIPEIDFPDHSLPYTIS